ncbi:MAG: hypothetical protein BJ554DRAFT_863 [Olpidium bornovanus]|uniref:Methyltransferase small domain-containing protein n=1 Tax=Olpidium bornovanus TaxID=278681 RepID=A0A8H7ZTB7_9FUNG|nr:MAG: hypothetical protein BJ554DRAFT_863 [Olpidium bornovanus]
MFPTPDLSHLSKRDFDAVYEPAGVCVCVWSLSRSLSLSPSPSLSLFRREPNQNRPPGVSLSNSEDTFLLLDALEQDARALRDLRPAICLELGLPALVTVKRPLPPRPRRHIFACQTQFAQNQRNDQSVVSTSSGTGCVTVFLAKLLAPLSPLFLCTDVSPSACKATAATAGQNEVELVEAVNTWFVDGLARRIEKSVDVLIFNPPYVVTPSDEVYTRRDVGKRGAAIEAAWAGGSDGREVIDMMLDIVDVGNNNGSAATDWKRGCHWGGSALSRGRVLHRAHQAKQAGGDSRYSQATIWTGKQSQWEGVNRPAYGQVAAQRRAGRENLFIVKFWRSRPTPE